MSLTAAPRASNPSQPNTVTEIKYSSLNSTTRDHGPSTGTKETPGHRLCDEFWHGTVQGPYSSATGRFGCRSSANAASVSIGSGLTRPCARPDGHRSPTEWARAPPDARAEQVLVQPRV